jgi:hypothetical protein
MDAQDDRVRIPITLPGATYAWLRQTAAARRVSMAEVIRGALERARQEDTDDDSV